MEARLITQGSGSSLRNLSSPSPQIHKPAVRKFHVVAAAVTTPTHNRNIATDDHKLNVKPTGLLITEKTVHNDSWFDRIAISHLAESLQATTGIRNRNSSGYESLVEAATAVSRNFSPVKQHELVIQALEKAFPRPILSMIRRLLPESQFAREFFAAFTTVFFVWLVGPCQVKESEISGKTEKNVVHVKKCRFLEETNCVGMCTNMCKMPSQAFIKDSFGIPINMVPNFDDMSCKMIFGEEPPPPSDDPAFKQPCYRICKANYKHNSKCFT